MHFRPKAQQAGTGHNYTEKISISISIENTNS